jgi:hypothetical protein
MVPECPVMSTVFDVNLLNQDPEWSSLYGTYVEMVHFTLHPQHSCLHGETVVSLRLLRCPSIDICSAETAMWQPSM